MAFKRAKHSLEIDIVQSSMLIDLVLDPVQLNQVDFGKLLEN